MGKDERRAANREARSEESDRIVGETGTESVAILRNPREMDFKAELLRLLREDCEVRSAIIKAIRRWIL